ncbi:phosphoribosylanthranilate isomerase [Sphingomonas vulcanisoli]|uniref:N-(5'-phosphoribosyl)anthranilate isomerase n=1 Tax=Sphingomonas vulcanisoli TaxID=1658060 RepID=A0ABX0TPJ6_9SPHN|nr:phosphoribosylanthranilate isomerase [Sphingomonas vulcanisoli]NIJ07462.1 phosphoribosylanthranilate isomerase [Sphingomonas vulcanisoli]
MPVRTKICGVTTNAAMDAAIAGGAAWIGFVFCAPSPRNIDSQAAAALIARAPNHVGKVGVFVDAEDGAIAAAVAAGLTAIQLHGKESPEQAASLGRRYGIEVWKAAPVRTRDDLALVTRYRGAADRILYDAKAPADAVIPGGQGLRFDWRLLEGFDHPLPWLLSGGLDAGNLREAIGITGAPAVDVSSGVESAPGIKDVDKIAAFLKAAAQ